MSHESDDPIIEALLEETLGNVRPPDLSARILQLHAARKTNAPIPLSIIKKSDAAANVSTDSHPATASLARRRFFRTLRRAALAAATIGATIIVSYWGYDYLARTPAPNHTNGNIAEASPKSRKNSAPESKQPNESMAVNPRVEDSNRIEQPPQRTPHGSSPGTETIAEKSPSLPNKPVSPAIAATPGKAASDREITAFVNAEIRRVWNETRVSPAPEATDAEWCRRVYLRLLGRIPTVEEITEFTLDKSSSRTETLVDRLLHEERYAEEFVAHWSQVFADVLIGRGVGLADNEPASRRGLEQYLRAAFRKNMSFAEITRELLTAEGAGRPGSKDFNGAVNFLIANFDERGTTLAARTSRVFLGQQLHCVQCHDHPTEPLKQAAFWNLTAFFRQARLERSGSETVLVDRDFLGDDRNDEDGTVFYETAAGLMKAAYPALSDGRTPETSGGRVADSQRRAELAELIITSEAFPRAIVNRLWAQFFGYGFTRPIDAMGVSNPPSHPELLARLAGEFRDSNFDLKRTLRWIALSNAFRRSSRVTDDALVDLPESGTRAYFSRYYTRPMQAEEVYQSLRIAAQLRRDSGKNGGTIEQARVDWLANYRRRAASNDDESPMNPTVNQSLILMNGELMKRATTPGHENLLRGVLQSKLTFEQRIDHLFLAALSRKPTKQELAAAKSLAGDNQREESAALEDVWWALLNSNEFILDH